MFEDAGQVIISIRIAICTSGSGIPVVQFKIVCSLLFCIVPYFTSLLVYPNKPENRQAIDLLPASSTGCFAGY